MLNDRSSLQEPLLPEEHVFSSLDVPYSLEVKEEKRTSEENERLVLDKLIMLNQITRFLQERIKLDPDEFKNDHEKKEKNYQTVARTGCSLLFFALVGITVYLSLYSDKKWKSLRISQDQFKFGKQPPSNQSCTEQGYNSGYCIQDFADALCDALKNKICKINNQSVASLMGAMATGFGSFYALTGVFACEPRYKQQSVFHNLDVSKMPQAFKEALADFAEQHQIPVDIELPKLINYFENEKNKLKQTVEFKNYQTKKFSRLLMFQAQDLGPVITIDGVRDIIAGYAEEPEPEVNVVVHRLG